MLSLIVMVIVAGASIASFAVLRRGEERQDKALLAESQGEVVLLLQATVQTLQSELKSVAFFTAGSGNSPKIFAQEAAPLLTETTNSVALVDISGPQPQVLMATGPDLHQGTALPGPLAVAISLAATSLSSSVVEVDGRSLLVSEAAPSPDPHLVGVETSLLRPGVPSPERSGPYAHVYIDVYASAQANPGQLILTTFGPGPLPQPVFSSVLRFGHIRWRVAAAQKTSLAGTYAELSPWIALTIGLLLALALASLVEALARRERHTARLVAERTRELLEAQKVLVRNERLAAVGELATVVGHELRNPLGAVLNELYLLRLSVGELASESERHVSAIERQVNRAAQLSEDLTSYVRDREPVLAEVDFRHLVEDVLETTRPRPGVDVSVEGTAHFVADASLMAQVLGNLVANAYQAVPNGGSIRVTAVDGDDATTISVEDSGPGVDPEVAGRIFDPFFTTKAEGTGLGLAIVQRLVELHDGTVSIENAPTGGAKATIRLPKLRQ